ncbi:CHAD domain-containing protein [Anaerolineales bacterium HSG25]|nr:CHAD domain-containing protein [Anaerolineales bacterium HSG25]
MFDMLTAEEKAVLERIAKSDNNLLAKRATIILITNQSASLEEISRLVELTTRTVKRWQQKFGDVRLNIFPKTFLEEMSQTPESEEDDPETQTEAVEQVEEVATANEEMLTTDEEVATTDEVAPEEVDAEAEVETEVVTDVETDSSTPEPAEESAPIVETEPTPPEAIPTIGLDPTDTLAEGGRKILKFHFKRMLDNEAGTRLGEDTESLHDMRVATRRMRAAFELFGDSYIKANVKPLQKGLKATAQMLGAVRDLDVFMEKLTAYQQTLDEAEQGELLPLIEYCQQRREQARAEMLAYLEHKSYAKFKKAFKKFVNTPGKGAKAVLTNQPVPYQLRHVVSSLIYQRYEAVRAYDPLLHTPSIERLHELRISFKGFRYGLEYFRELLGNDGESVIKQLKLIQDHLGDLNDASVATDLLDEFLKNWKFYRDDLPSADKKKPRAVRVYLKHNIATGKDLVDSFPTVWDEFNSPSVRRQVALAVASL